MSAKEIYDELGGVWGKDCPKYKTIITWVRGCGRISTNTCREPGVRSPKSVTTNKNVDAVYGMVMRAGCVTRIQIVDTLGLRYVTFNRSLQIELKVI